MRPIEANQLVSNLDYGDAAYLVISSS